MEPKKKKARKVSGILCLDGRVANCFNIVFLVLKLFDA